MTIDKFIDRLNVKKVWLVKRSKYGHYFLNSEVGGVIQSKRWVRVTCDQMLGTVCGA